jgi:hypothetical protein
MAFCAPASACSADCASPTDDSRIAVRARVSHAPSVSGCRCHDGDLFNRRRARRRPAQAGAHRVAQSVRRRAGVAPCRARRHRLGHLAVARRRLERRGPCPAGPDQPWPRRRDHSARSGAAPGTTDPDVLAWAAREDRILLTFDKDFGELARGSALPRGIGDGGHGGRVRLMRRPASYCRYRTALRSETGRLLRYACTRWLCPMWQDRPPKALGWQRSRSY